MTGLLINQFKQKIKGFTLIPDRGGCFEIVLDGDLIYSKLDTDEFPNEKSIAEIVAQRLNRPTSAVK